MIKLSLLPNSLSQLIYLTSLISIWLSSSKIFKQPEFKLFLEKSLSVILSTTKGRQLGLISLDRLIQPSNWLNNEMQLLYSRVFSNTFSSPMRLSSKLVPICWYILSTFLKFCSKFYAVATVRYFIRAGLKLPTTDEFLRNDLNNSSIVSSFLADCPNTMKASLTNG